VRPLHVLAVEDSATVRKLVELTARSQGWSAELAATGAEGIAAAIRRPPDVLLLDFVLPDMEGLAVCEALARRPLTAAIPVLLLTAKGAGLLRRFEPYPNVLGHLPKPFTEEQLVERLNRLHQPSPPAAQAVAPGARPAALPESARLLFEVLREGLGQIPAWEAERRGEPAAAYFAQRLLTPSVLRALARRAAARNPGREAGSRSSGSAGSQGGTPAEAPPAGPAAPPAHRPEDAAGPTVLLLDRDQSGFARPLASLLGALPRAHRLVAVEHFAALLGAAARARPAFVLVDPDELTEPDLAGLRAGLAPLAQGARLCALVGPQRAARRQALLAAGFDAVLVKPITRTELHRLFNHGATARGAVSQEVR
jgi:CheY-like chemotaxis protein